MNFQTQKKLFYTFLKRGLKGMGVFKRGLEGMGVFKRELEGIGGGRVFEMLNSSNFLLKSLIKYFLLV